MSKLIASQIKEFQQNSDDSISFVMSIKLAGSNFSDFLIQFALDIADEKSTQIFDVNFSVEQNTSKKNETEFLIKVNNFSLDSSIPFDKKTNICAFIVSYLSSKEKFSFHIPVYCSPAKKSTDDRNDNDFNEKISYHILLPADPPK